MITQKEIIDNLFRKEVILSGNYDKKDKYEAYHQPILDSVIMSIDQTNETYTGFIPVYYHSQSTVYTKLFIIIDAQCKLSLSDTIINGDRLRNIITKSSIEQRERVNSSDWLLRTTKTGTRLNHFKAKDGTYKDGMFYYVQLSTSLGEWKDERYNYEMITTSENQVLNKKYKIYDATECNYSFKSLLTTYEKLHLNKGESIEEFQEHLESKELKYLKKEKDELDKLDINPTIIHHHKSTSPRDSNSDLWK